MKLFKKRKLTKEQKTKLDVMSKMFLMFSIGLLGGVVIIIGMFSEQFPFDVLEYIDNRISSSTYDAVLFSNYDDNITIEIANLCGRFTNADEQIECMQSQIKFFYNYTEEDNHTLNNPDKYYEEGGVCRDMVILQKSVLLKMGWDVHYRFPMPNHVSISAYRQVECIKDNRTFCHTYCDIDGLYADCH